MLPPTPPSPETPPPADTPPPPPPPHSVRAHSVRAHSVRALRRSRTERMLGGVAGGVAQTYGVDVALVRIGFVLAAFIGGLGVVLYGVAWLVIPDDDSDAAPVHGPELRTNATQILAFVLVGLGAMIVFGRIIPDDGPDVFDFFWPLALIAGGVAILIARVRDENTVAEAAPEQAPPRDPAAPWAQPGADENATMRGTEAAPEATPPTAPEPETETAWNQGREWPRRPPHPRSPTWGTPPWGSPWGSPPGGWPRGPRAPRRPPRLIGIVGPLVTSVLLLFAGATALLDATDVVDVDVQAAAAVALMIVGIGLLVSAWLGRARGLVAIGLVLTVPLTTLAVLDVPFDGGVGDRSYHPRLASELRDDYRLGAGELTLDLRDLAIRGTVDIEASVALGSLRVLVPSDVDVVADAEVGLGSIELFGVEEDGVDPDLVRRADGGPDAPAIRLELRTGMGKVEVERYSVDGGTILEDAR